MPLTETSSPADETQYTQAWIAKGRAGVLSVVIPTRNEEGVIAATVDALTAALDGAGIAHEVLIVDDGSTDGTAAVLADLAANHASVRAIENRGAHGFGLAVRCGLLNFEGDVVAIYMADGSDDPDDLIAFHRKIGEGYDCVFGSRFVRGGRTEDYPALKLVLNRLANTFIRVLFRLPYNDVTNAFKCYRRDVIAGLQPLLAHHFNLTVELPLKAITRGYSYAVLPNSWRNRRTGESKLRIREMGSRYLFIVLYCLLEKWLSRGDYDRAKDRDG